MENMKKQFSLLSVLCCAMAVIALTLSSCVDETNDKPIPSFVMTKDNVSFVFPDTTVEMKGDIMTLQKIKSVVSTVMPANYQYGFFVDSVSGPVASSILLSSTTPLIKLTKTGFKTGEFLFDNSSTKFLPGDYQIYMGALTLEGRTYFRNNPIKVKIIPGFSTTLLSKIMTLNYPVGEPASIEGSFYLNGYYMKDQPITVTSSSSDFLISTTTGTGFAGTTSLTVTPTIDLNYKRVYVRMKSGLAVGDSLMGKITVESAGKTTVLLDVKGKVLPLKIVSTFLTLTNLDYNAGTGPSFDKTFTVSGDLTSNLVVTPPANFEIAKELGGVVGSYSSNPLTINKIAGGLVLPTILHVRLKKDLVAGYYTGDIALVSTGATTLNVAVKGTVY